MSRNPEVQADKRLSTLDKDSEYKNLIQNPAHWARLLRVVLTPFFTSLLLDSF